MERDVVVIGGGAAGLSGALLLARARLRVSVVDAGTPRNAPAAHMHGFLSRDGVPPGELVEAGRAEVAAYGGEHISDTVREVLPGFEVRLGSGATLRAPRILLASGMRDELPDVPGVAERWGRQVFQCPYCHGHEVRDQAIGVLATGPASVHQALLVRQWSDDIVLFEHTYELSDAERAQLKAWGIRSAKGVVKEVTSDGVQTVDELVPRQTVFVFPRFVPGVPAGLGLDTDERGFVIADENGATSTAGVWAAGNVVNSRAQVITAAGAGAAAAMAMHADLVHAQTVALLK